MSAMRRPGGQLLSTGRLETALTVLATAVVTAVLIADQRSDPGST
jgi:hypothetical protein